MPGTDVVILKSKNVFCLFINYIKTVGATTGGDPGMILMVTFYEGINV